MARYGMSLLNDRPNLSSCRSSSWQKERRMKARKYVCIDPGSIWGSFHEGTFKIMLEFGYLPEGSKWKNNSTGITYKIVGKQVSIWLGDEQRRPQRKVIIDVNR